MSGTGDPGSGDPGSADPGSADPSSGDPGSADPSSGDPGSGEAASSGSAEGISEGLSLGPPGASTTALSDAVDESILADIESGAAQLLSTAAPDGLADRFGSAQGGRIAGAQYNDPFTDVASATRTPNYFVGRDVDTFTNRAPEGANSNAFTGTQDAVSLTGLENAGSSGPSPAEAIPWARGEAEPSSPSVRQMGPIIREYSEADSPHEQWVRETIIVVPAPDTSQRAKDTAVAVPDTSPWATGEAEPAPPTIREPTSFVREYPEPVSQGGQWVKETVILIPVEEVNFYASQNTPPPPPDHSIGYYPLKDADKRLTELYGGYWDMIKTALFEYGPLRDIAPLAGIVEDIAPYNAPDHFVSAGRYANRWVWYSQRGQTGTGLVELLKGHFEASSAVGSVEAGGAILKGGVSAGAAAIAKSKMPAKAPTGYSVALEIPLEPGEVPTFESDADRRTRHRDIGQKNVRKLLDDWSKSPDPETRQLVERMNKLLRNSDEWHLHHDPQRPGVLQLVPTDQHQAAAYQDFFHPFIGKPSSRTTGRVGGYFIWGLDY